MIVPFLFGIEKNEIHYLWIFYKYMDFCLENDYPIIAEEAYFEDPKIYEKEGEYSFQNVKDNYNYRHQFKKPTLSDINKLKKEIITRKEKEKVLKKDEEYLKNCQKLLINDDGPFHELIEKKITNIEKKYGKIEAIITWTWYRELKKVCDSKNITLILYEQTSFRMPNYSNILGYFQFFDKYDSEKVDKNYLSFCAESEGKNKFLTRKEIISYFIDKNKLNIINHLNDQPKYEFGINIGAEFDPLAEANCNCTNDTVLKSIRKLVANNKISIRLHPMNNQKEKYKKLYNIDNSPSSIDWIINNRRIASTGSNIAFETMLYSRTTYILGDNFPYRNGAVNNVNMIDEKIADIKYINYLVFGYYVPYELMFNSDYIKWRLTSPSQWEIYEKNINYLLSKYKIDAMIFKKSENDRLKIIMKKVHKLSNIEIDNILNENNYLKDIYEKNIYEINRKSSEKICELTDEINRMKNSKSWRITRPLRYIASKIKTR